VSRCPHCPQVPVVSEVCASRRLHRLAEYKVQRALLLAMQWLTERHAGLKLYEGIQGRQYTNYEKDRIAVETGLVEPLDCPLWQRGECVIGGLGMEYTRRRELGRGPYGWLPTLIAKFYDRDGFRSLIKQGAIADVKVALLTRNEYFLTKGDVEALQAGRVRMGDHARTTPPEILAAAGYESG